MEKCSLMCSMVLCAAMSLSFALPNDIDTNIIPDEGNIEDILLNSMGPEEQQDKSFVKKISGFINRMTFDMNPASEVCYEDLGCFSNSYPWWSITTRPISLLPEAPEVINTRFLLYTRENPQEEWELIHNQALNLALSEFDASKKTVYIVHGFTDNAYNAWIQKMKDEILTFEDVNVIIVEWKDGAYMNYLRAVSNARVVGAVIARMINWLKQEAGAPIANIHIIGHDLGAHIAGYVGTAVADIPRISGLDPPRIYFDSSETLIRLDASDAKYVDVIHTDAGTWFALKLGLTRISGHSDYFPNGGSDQPGCKNGLSNILSSVWDIVTLNFTGVLSDYACSHYRSADYFTESINGCPYLGYSCQSWAQFQKGSCYSLCSNTNSCGEMGYYSSPGDTGVYYLNIPGTSNTTFCQKQIRVDINVASIQKQTSGTVEVAIVGPYGTSNKTQIHSGTIKPSQLLYKYLDIDENETGQMTGLTLSYTGKSSTDELSISRITLRTIGQGKQVEKKSINSVLLKNSVDLEVSVN